MVTNLDVGPIVCLFLHVCLRSGSTDLLPTWHVNTCKLSCLNRQHVQATMLLASYSAVGVVLLGSFACHGLASSYGRGCFPAQDWHRVACGDVAVILRVARGLRPVVAMDSSVHIHSGL